MKKISGVYKITNTVTGDFYIGSSRNVKHRWSNHKSISTWTQNPNLRLYQDMAKYGLNNFLFELIEETDMLKEREQYWIDQLKPTYNTIRANGPDIERCKEWYKEYYEVHRNENISKCKAYYRDHHAEIKNSYKRICSYEGEELTLSALSIRFRRKGILHPTLEAKKYLINKYN